MDQTRYTCVRLLEASATMPGRVAGSGQVLVGDAVPGGADDALSGPVARFELHQLWREQVNGRDESTEPWTSAKPSLHFPVEPVVL
jgi:hypothetical protein